MVKRRLGSALGARLEINQFHEIVLRAITHNVMIVRLEVFYRAVSVHFSGQIIELKPFLSGQIIELKPFLPRALDVRFATPRHEQIVNK